jgi:hypothetical protein
LAGFPWEFAFFANGHEARAEAVGHGGGEDETAGVNPDDFVDFDIAGSGAELGDGFAEEQSVGENGGDVFEDDSRFWEIDHITDGGAELFGGGHWARSVCSGCGEWKCEFAQDARSRLVALFLAGGKWSIEWRCFVLPTT